jgi:outer membrane protein assembly factor BamB
MKARLVHALFLAAVSLHTVAEDWPGWRGPRGDGTSLETNAPVHWSAASNVVWQVAVPGAGHASPIVWRDRLFTVSAIADTEERVVLCFDAASGRQLWQQTVVKAPFERTHPLNSHASSTPATDGEFVFSAFLDVRDVVVTAHDFSGKQRWQVRPGKFSSMHGFCSSPVIFEDRVIVNCDHDGDGYLVALARGDGRELWRIERPNKTRSYCAPTIFEAGGRTQMVLSGTLCVASYDPRTGRQHWIIDGPTEQFVASIVLNRRANLFFMTGGFPEHHLLAIKPDGTGNVTQSHIAWRHNRASYVSYVPSPIAEGDYFLVVSDPGYACCFEAATGKLVWQEKLGEHHASLVSAAGLVYFLADDGVTTVVRPGPVFATVARNEIGEKCFASPALSRGRLYLRGDKSLFCIRSGVSPQF